MKLVLKENLKRAEWDKFVRDRAADGGFLQSWQWGEFQQSLGRKIWRLAVMDSSEVIAAALIVRHSLPLGQNYLYLPRGPVVASDLLHQKKAVEQFLYSSIKNLAVQENSIFVRLDPPLHDGLQYPDDSGRFSPAGQVQPKCTLILDLTAAEAKLLSQMKPKTRYNIKVAQKHSIAIEYGGAKDFDEFWRLMQLTGKRDQITVHSKDYYQKMLNLPDVRLVLAKLDGRIVATAIAVFFGDWAIYLHGASDYEYRGVMAPYLLQWQMIKDAKAAGCRYYDFWGADEKLWPGVTRFKVGFAPAQPLVGYAGAFDLPINRMKYAAYKLLKKIKK